MSNVNNFNLNNFKTLTSALFFIMFLPIILLSTALLGVIIVAAVLLLMPKDTFTTLISFIPMSTISSELMHEGIIVSELPNDIEINKMPILLNLFIGAVQIALFMLICYIAILLLNNLKDGDIFKLRNSQFIEYMAYVFIGLAILSGVEQLASTYAYLDFYNINQELMKSVHPLIADHAKLEYHYRVDLTLLFVGFIIWILGRIFKYGTYLQEEYDQTV